MNKVTRVAENAFGRHPDIGSVPRESVVVSLIQSGELEIDKEGEIWRVAKRRGVSKNRPGVSVIAPCRRVRAEYPERGGYLLIRVMVRAKSVAASAHRVVWTYFNGTIPDGMTINHKNGIRADNRPSNLELATMSEQRLHAIHVLGAEHWNCKGQNHPKTHLCDEDVREIRRLRGQGIRGVDIAKKYNMNPRSISSICNRVTWKHI